MASAAADGSETVAVGQASVGVGSIVSKVQRCIVLVAVIAAAGSAGALGWRAIHRSTGPPWRHATVRDVGLSPDRRTVYAAAADDLHCGEVRVRVEPSTR